MPGFSYFLFSLITTEIQYSKVTVTWFLFFSVAMRLEWKILRNEAFCPFIHSFWKAGQIILLTKGNRRSSITDSHSSNSKY